jgi:hypothetical protein
MYCQNVLGSYENALKFVNSARNVSKGKALRSWARAFIDNETKVVYVVPKWDFETRLAEFHPDNTLHMTVAPQYVARWATTIVGSIHRALPVSFLRVGTQRYRIESNQTMVDVTKEGKQRNNEDYHSYVHSYRHIKTQAPEYFQGMILDLKTNTWTNRKPDRLSNVDTKVRSEWLSKLKVFKRGIKLRAKMGVFDGLINQVQAQDGATRRWERPNPKLETKMKVIADAIRNDEYPVELMKDFVLHAHRNQWHNLNSTIVVNQIDDYLKQQSINIREAFGVFKI